MQRWRAIYGDLLLFLHINRYLFDKLENNPPLISQCKHLLEEYFKFTIVRNPWDKELSDYFFNKRLGRNVGSNLTEYFNHPITNKPFWHENQLTWITDENNNINADFIGRFESLQEDFNTICDAIGIPRQELPHKNKTKHKHYTEYYDDETRQIVAEKYAKDIEYFGYKFGE